ncbi:hypothetical protein [Tsukamurella soli]|uniref:SWIM-type domain-containing protein n=1 Tax=Tsukamurella soli TaxID=644556 RepID=A0ABP8KGP6_9ACTN
MARAGGGAAGQGRAPQRKMGTTWFSRALIRQAEDRTERRKVVYARRLYNERAVYSVAVRDGRASATVQGTQLDPFGVELTRPVADPDTVVAVLAGEGATGELTAVARGDLGRTLGGLVLPEAGDLSADCTCPDPSGACAHALALIYEVAAAAAAEPALLLDFAGVPLAALIARTTTSRTSPTRLPPAPALPPGDDGGDPVARDRAMFYGGGTLLPPLPEPAPVDPTDLLDPAMLRTALRRSGTRAADAVQATEELAELYARLREPR